MNEEQLEIKLGLNRARNKVIDLTSNILIYVNDIIKC